ncbi:MULTISPECIES: transglutaminase-like domain-containing protein [Lysinibacillus]|uniref:transglutaminase-like domain-containing protein n=1 Tax=Lysinibacillus TaxID=400634 RepID=UPI0004DA6D4E|nr:MULTISPECIES: transglutaminase-like domain-containing protein [Lysinibacillus]AJK85915.1 hypothetical protein HR49_01095 [Lysinibacillus fusiformis]KHK50473.1 hypothetical protein PI85_17520 [Lysinibacillus sp. A1]
MKKKIILLAIATLCIVLAACTNEKVITSSEGNTTNKMIQIILPIVSNSGNASYTLTKEEMKNLFAEVATISNLSQKIINDFSLNNLTIEVPHGSYKCDDEVYTFSLNKAKVEKGIINEKQQIGLYFHEIKLNYKTDVIRKNIQIEQSPDVALLDHYTGKVKTYNLGNLENTQENIVAFVGEKLNSLNIKELQNDVIIDELLSVYPVDSSGDTEEIARAGYKYIIGKYEYDDSQKGDESYISLQEFIEEKKGICNQFSYLYKLYLDYNDIENRIAYGNFKDQKYYVDHVWNEVKIDGKWVSVDTTGNGFGSEGTYENYFVSHYSSF